MDNDHKQRAAVSGKTSGHSNNVTAYNEPFGALIAFWKLPLELQQRILQAACGPPVLERYTTVGRSTDCGTTMLSLVHAAKVFSPLITPLLYRHVRLTRPSALHAFLRTLCGYPPLGQLVRSLHLGDDKQLPDDWWPVRGEDATGSGHSLLRLGLGSSNEKGWRDCPSLDLDTDDFDSDPAKANALDEAFQAAMRYFNVTLDGPRDITASRQAHNDELCVGVFELRAAMELYSLELLRCEATAEQVAKRAVERGKRRKVIKSNSQEKQLSYPRLRIGASPLPPSSVGDFEREVFELDRQQILQRLTSTGSPTDAFNHPYLFARSGASWWASGFRAQLYLGEGQILSVDPTGQAWSSFSTAYPPTTSDAGSGTSASAFAPSSIHTTSSFAPTTVLQNVALGERVVALTPALRCLSLAGLFTLLAAGESLAPLQALQSLTIGPPPSAWLQPRTLKFPALNGLKRLRICGMILGEACDIILGDNSALQQLEEFQWSVTRSNGRRHDIDVRNLAQATVGHHPMASAASVTKVEDQQSLGQHREADSCQELEQGSAPGTNPRSRRAAVYIDARLPTRDVAAVLDAAPTALIGHAWREGYPEPEARHRLRLTNTSRDQRVGTKQEMYDEGREWWERG